MRVLWQTTTFQIRLEIGEHAAAGLNDPQIASVVGCSVWTVRKWRRRSLHQGRVGLTSQMGRPANGPVSTFPNAVKEALLQLRKLHPGWGPDSLLTALKTDACWADHPLPSRAQLARLLKHAGLTRRYQPHHDLIQPARASLTEPHQEWQMDAQGMMRVEGVGKVSLISIVDVVSRWHRPKVIPVSKRPILLCRTTNERCAERSWPMVCRRSSPWIMAPFSTTTPLLRLFPHGCMYGCLPSASKCALRASVAPPITPSSSAPIRRSRLRHCWGKPILLTPLYGLVWMNVAMCSIIICPVGFSPTNPLCRPIPRPFIRGDSTEPPWEEEFLSLEKVSTYLAQSRWFRSIRTNGCFDARRAIATILAITLPDAASPLALILTPPPCSVSPKEAKRPFDCLPKVSRRQS